MLHNSNRRNRELCQHPHTLAVFYEILECAHSNQNVSVLRKILKSGWKFLSGRPREGMNSCLCNNQSPMSVMYSFVGMVWVKKRLAVFGKWVKFEEVIVNSYSVSCQYAEYITITPWPVFSASCFSFSNSFSNLFIFYQKILYSNNHHALNLSLMILWMPKEPCALSFMKIDLIFLDLSPHTCWLSVATKVLDTS